MYESSNEIKIKQILSDLGIPVISQYEVPDSTLVADFFLPESKTVLEINGPIHFIKRIVEKDGQKMVEITD